MSRNTAPASSRWDTLHIDEVVNATLDGFAYQFYGVELFNKLPPPERAKVVRAIKANCAERLTTSGGQVIA